MWGLEEQSTNKGVEVPFPGDRRKYVNMVTPTSDNEGVGDSWKRYQRLTKDYTGPRIIGTRRGTLEEGREGRKGPRSTGLRGKMTYKR